MGFRDLKRRLSEEPSISWQAIPEGVVCNFDDGADYVVLRKPPSDPVSWICEFKLLNRRRTRFIATLKTCLTARGLILQIRETGACYGDDLEDVGGELWLGENLSDLLRNHSEAEAYVEFNKQHFLSTSPEQFAESLRLGIQDATSPALDELVPTKPDVFQVAVVAWGLGSIADRDFLEAPSTEACDALREKNPVIDLAIRLISRFRGRTHTENGELRISAGEKAISWNAGDLLQRISAKNLDLVFREIVAQVEAEDCERDLLENLFLSHLAGLGLAKDENWNGEVNFGSTHVQYTCDVKRLLESENPRAAMQDWLRENSLSEIVSDEAVNIMVSRNLPPSVPMAVPCLDDYDFDKLRGEANAIVAQHIKDGFTYPSESWGDRLWNPDQSDPWATEAWWFELAEKRNDRALLWRLGDHVALYETVNECKRLAAAGWDAGFCVYEGCIPLDVLRGLAHAWPDANPVEIFEGDVNGRTRRAPWSRFFRCLPYEFKRLARGRVRDELNELEDASLTEVADALNLFNAEEILDFLSQSEIDAIRDRCLVVANGEFRDDGAGTEFLRVAHWFGWFDVADVVTENSRFWEAFRTWPAQTMMVGEYALALSLFERPDLTRRLAAWTLNVDAVRYRGESRRRDLLCYFNDDRSTQRLAAAIAWHRTDASE